MLALFEYVLKQIGPACFKDLSQGVLRGTLGNPIHGLSPASALRAAALEPLGRWDIRP
jgi:hypothetical protein